MSEVSLRVVELARSVNAPRGDGMAPWRDRILANENTVVHLLDNGWVRVQWGLAKVTWYLSPQAIVSVETWGAPVDPPYKGDPDAPLTERTSSVGELARPRRVGRKPKMVPDGPLG